MKNRGQAVKEWETDTMSHSETDLYTSAFTGLDDLMYWPGGWGDFTSVQVPVFYSLCLLHRLMQVIWVSNQRRPVQTPSYAH